MSPRFSHELTRIPVLASLPGDILNRLGAKMQREQVAPGKAVAGAGEGERFYVVLSGMLTATLPDGTRRALRPGDTFGGPAASDLAAQAVRAVTPASLGSFDRATYDELIAPAR